MKRTICTYQSPDASHMIVDWRVDMSNKGRLRHVVASHDIDAHPGFPKFTKFVVTTTDGDVEELYAVPINNDNPRDAIGGLLTCLQLVAGVSAYQPAPPPGALVTPWDKALHFGKIPPSILVPLTQYWSKYVKDDES